MALANTPEKAYLPDWQHSPIGITSGMKYPVRDLVPTWLSLCRTVFSSVQAQTLNLRLDYLSVKDGIPGSEVHSIVRDRQGFIWIGTRRCPARYDGSTISPFLYPQFYRKYTHYYS